MQIQVSMCRVPVLLLLLYPPEPRDFCPSLRPFWSTVGIWFLEVVKAFNKEDRARLLQFVTGKSKVPLEGFKALQGISGPQRFQIHKAYGAPERLPFGLLPIYLT